MESKHTIKRHIASLDLKIKTELYTVYEVFTLNIKAQVG